MRKRKNSSDEKHATTAITRIWFILVDEATGSPYKENGHSTVSLPSNAVVDQFRDAVKEENKNGLKGIPASALLVYQSRDAFDKRMDFEEKAYY